MRRRLTPLALLALTLALPASAHAAFFPAENIDGPNADIVSVGDVDLSRDGGGGVTYLKRVGGVDHAFHSRLFRGAFLRPEQIDAGLAGASQQPVVAVSDLGRIAVAFVNEGNLYARVRPTRSRGFTPAVLVAQGGVSNPSIDMSVHGVTYISWTQNGDVRAARAPRDSAQFTVVPAPMDADAGKTAGMGEGRSRVISPADGNAMVAWGEEGADNRMHVFTRRLFGTNPSVAVRDLTVGDAGSADRPEFDMEDDSSFAQVVFRQQTAAGPRSLMRRLRGSDYDDAVPTAGDTNTNRVRVDLSGRGEGLVATQASGNEVIGAPLWNNGLAGFSRWDAGPSGVESMPVPAVGENEEGVIAYLQGNSGGDASVQGRLVEGLKAPRIRPAVVLSRPEWGPVDAAAGMDAASSRRADVAIVFVQGAPGARRLVAAFYDQEPSRSVPWTGSNPRIVRELRWQPAVDLLGRVTYRVMVDGKLLAQTQRSRMAVKKGKIKRGRHTWRIVVVDRRGQRSTSKTGILRALPR